MKIEIGSLLYINKINTSFINYMIAVFYLIGIITIKFLFFLIKEHKI